MVEKVSSVKIVKGIKLPREAGQYHRLLCMTGKNKGMSYYIKSKRLVMGRSETADVQILDVKSSREHAELKLVSGKYVLTDLGSQNGVIVNDLKVSQHTLIDNDKIIIGQTVYKYNKVVIEEPEIIEIDSDEDEEELEEYEDIADDKAKKEPPKKKNLLVIGVIALGAIFLIPTEDSSKKDSQKSKRIGQIDTIQIDIAEYDEEEINDPEVRQKLKAYLHRGQREYRESNFYRAIEQFELALILVPNHGYATFYRQRAEESLNKFIDRIVAKAENDIEALRYRSAVIQYCSIITFLQDNPKHLRYVEAEKKITELEIKMGVDEGEFKCF